jgi:hypothetical protein
MITEVVNHVGEPNNFDAALNPGKIGPAAPAIGKSTSQFTSTPPASNMYELPLHARGDSPSQISC